LAAPAYVLFLFWISRQYRMLDVMPIALKNILDKVNSGMLVSDPNSKLLYANEYANNLLGLKLSPHILQLRELSIADLFKNKFDFSSPRKQEVQLEIEDRNQVGKKRYLDAISQPIFNPKSAKHIGATIALHDVTERKHAEMELQKLDRQKSDFFAGISHEFRTPLTLSLGNLDDVLDDVDNISPHELKASLTHVKNNNKRLLNLVNQLLELSQLDAGSLQIQPTLLRLDFYLPSIVANFELQASKQNSHIHIAFDDQMAQHPELYFDVQAFDKVILNLVSNALKSMPSGGDVYIHVSSADDQYLQLTVRDTGCGIPAEALSKVFEMFYSHQNDNAAWPQGAGVGLSLVKQLLKQHGAEIDVSSIEGQGTTFTLSLRRGYAHFSEAMTVQHQEHVEKNTLIRSDDTLTRLEDEVEPVATDNTSVLSGLKKINQSEVSEKLVLLVEDNAEMRAYIRKHLTINFRLLEAADGEEGLALARQTMPDLVLSDVMMPKMNGYELCKQLKSDLQTSHIPVLLLTAKSSQTEKLEGLELGADDYLSKPFDLKELTLRMSNLISSRRTIKEFYQSNGLQKVIDNPAIPKREAAFLDSLQKYVRENISDADIKVSDLAQAVFMSERSLSRKLKVLTGDTPKKMLLIIRLDYAKDLLHSTDDSITHLSYRAGFADASHFTRSFKAHCSMTPTEFRKMRMSG
ncbi:MAG: ATP-binding protein, partial [Thiotrichaceae bacterium]